MLPDVAGKKRNIRDQGSPFAETSITGNGAYKKLAIDSICKKLNIKPTEKSVIKWTPPAYNMPEGVRQRPVTLTQIIPEADGFKLKHFTSSHKNDSY